MADVCGGCLRPLKRCGCSTRADTPREDRTSSLDNPKWQAKKRKDEERFNHIKESRERRAQKFSLRDLFR